LLLMLREFFKTFRDLWSKPAGRAMLVFFLVLLGGGSLFYKLVEGWSWIDSVYFTMVTLTTVGFGDLHPTKDVSKLFTVVFIMVGVGFILAFLNLIFKIAAERRAIDKGWASEGGDLGKQQQREPGRNEQN
jgi:voltage-gated potassium channel